jgi:hypothetical protein
MAAGRRYRVDEENGESGNWVFNAKTGNTTKVCRTRKEAREFAAKKNNK